MHEIVHEFVGVRVSVTVRLDERCRVPGHGGIGLHQRLQMDKMMLHIGASLRTGTSVKGG